MDYLNQNRDAALRAQLQDAVVEDALNTVVKGTWLYIAIKIWMWAAAFAVLGFIGMFLFWRDLWVWYVIIFAVVLIFLLRDSFRNSAPINARVRVGRFFQTRGISNTNWNNFRTFIEDEEHRAPMSAWVHMPEDWSYAVERGENLWFWADDMRRQDPERLARIANSFSLS